MSLKEEILGLAQAIHEVCLDLPKDELENVGECYLCYVLSRPPVSCLPERRVINRVDLSPGTREYLLDLIHLIEDDFDDSFAKYLRDKYAVEEDYPAGNNALRVRWLREIAENV